MKTENSIFISIASYMDLELVDTVYSALSKANNPEKIFVSVCSQDIDTGHPKLESLFDMFNVLGYSYIKMNYKDAKGVGFARNQTQQSLSNDYEFYIQVDSHTQFINNWDSMLIESYKKIEDYWKGKVVLTAYPSGYLYTEYGNIKMPEVIDTTCVRIQYSQNEVLVYEPKYKAWEGNEYGEYHGYLCAGFAFGRSEYFIEVPYDPEIYFNGEEQTLSIRFYCKDIKLISPTRSYVYHHYDGVRRSRHWEKTPNWELHDENGKNRLFAFFSGADLGVYGISDLPKYAEWIGRFVKPWQGDV